DPIVISDDGKEVEALRSTVFTAAHVEADQNPRIHKWGEYCKSFGGLAPIGIDHSAEPISIFVKFAPEAPHKPKYFMIKGCKEVEVLENAVKIGDGLAGCLF
ncbi:MAG: hypothetical protein Q9179_007967, partial [Wetmoreana sp. 5 TL-2023]